jgi:hypothetical protein
MQRDRATPDDHKRNSSFATPTTTGMRLRDRFISLW